MEYDERASIALYFGATKENLGEDSLQALFGKKK